MRLKHSIKAILLFIIIIMMPGCSYDYKNEVSTIDDSKNKSKEIECSLCSTTDEENIQWYTSRILSGENIDYIAYRLNKFLENPNPESGSFLFTTLRDESTSAVENCEKDSDIYYEYHAIRTLAMGW